MWYINARLIDSLIYLFTHVKVLNTTDNQVTKTTKSLQHDEALRELTIY